ncbi:MAG: hypothetical protein AAF848_08425 [Pseudomonadota bacterium]
MDIFDSKRVLLGLIALALVVGGPFILLMVFLGVYAPETLSDPLIILCFLLAGPGMASLAVPPVRRLLNPAPVLSLTPSAFILHPRTWLGGSRPSVALPWREIARITRVRMSRGADYLEVTHRSGPNPIRVNIQYMRISRKDLEDALSAHATAAGITVTRDVQPGLITSRTTLTLTD